MVTRNRFLPATRLLGFAPLLQESKDAPVRTLRFVQLRALDRVTAPLRLFHLLNLVSVSSSNLNLKLILFSGNENRGNHRSTATLPPGAHQNSVGTVPESEGEYDFRNNTFEATSNTFSVATKEPENRGPAKKQAIRDFVNVEPDDAADEYEQISDAVLDQMLRSGATPQRSVSCLQMTVLGKKWVQTEKAFRSPRFHPMQVHSSKFVAVTSRIQIPRHLDKGLVVTNLPCQQYLNNVQL